MHEVLGPHQYKYIGSEQDINKSYYKFELDYDYIRKKVRIRPRHPYATIYGFGFTPNEARFDLTLKTVVDFIYSGPLPDLTILSVRRTTDKVDVTVKNIGGLKAGKFKVEIFYDLYNKSTGGGGFKSKERYVSELAAGASVVVDFYVPSQPHISISKLRAMADRPGYLVESDEGNNQWGYD